MRLGETKTRICVMPGCAAEVHARSLCHTHYMRKRRHGSADAVNRPADWGSRDKHPLYERYKSMCRAAGKRLSAEWSDFWKFVGDVGQPPSPEHRLYRIDSDGKWGPGNVEWRERLVVQDQKTRDGRAAYMREYWQRSPHVLKRAYLKRHYGITLEHYNDLYDRQGGVCAICNKPETAVHRQTGEAMLLPYDHDHTSGNGRGLLCSLCNRGLGMFQDDHLRLQAAIDYLKRHGA